MTPFGPYRLVQGPGGHVLRVHAMMVGMFELTLEPWGSGYNLFSLSCREFRRPLLLPTSTLRYGSQEPVFASIDVIRHERQLGHYCVPLGQPHFFDLAYPMGEDNPPVPLAAGAPASLGDTTPPDLVESELVELRAAIQLRQFQSIRVADRVPPEMHGLRCLPGRLTLEALYQVKFDLDCGEVPARGRVVVVPHGETRDAQELLGFRVVEDDLPEGLMFTTPGCVEQRGHSLCAPASSSQFHADAEWMLEQLDAHEGSDLDMPESFQQVVPVPGIRPVSGDSSQFTPESSSSSAIRRLSHEEWEAEQM